MYTKEESANNEEPAHQDLKLYSTSTHLTTLMPPSLEIASSLSSELEEAIPKPPCSASLEPVGLGNPLPLPLPKLLFGLSTSSSPTTGNPSLPETEVSVLNGYIAFPNCTFSRSSERLDGGFEGEGLEFGGVVEKV